MLLAQISYRKYPGIKLVNWDVAACRTLAQISTNLPTLSIPVFDCTG